MSGLISVFDPLPLPVTSNDYVEIIRPKPLELDRYENYRAPLSEIIAIQTSVNNFGVGEFTTRAEAIAGVDSERGLSADALGAALADVLQNRIIAGNADVTLTYDPVTRTLRIDATGVTPGGGGTIGVDWFLQTPPEYVPATDLIFGDDKLVMVTSSSQLLISEDAQNWDLVAGVDNQSWRAGCYGGGLFLMVSATGTGNGNRVQTSPDGETWTQQTTYFSGSSDPVWRSVAHGNGIFLAVASQAAIGDSATNLAMTSPDGVTWTVRALPITQGLESVTFNGTFFLAVGGGRWFKTTDGVTWDYGDMPVFGWYNVNWLNGQFVALRNVNEAGVATSPDGETWTMRVTPNTDAFWFKSAYGAGIYVAVAAFTGGVESELVMISEDAVNWQLIDAHSGAWEGLKFAFGKFVAVGNDNPNHIMTSLGFD